MSTNLRRFLNPKIPLTSLAEEKLQKILQLPDVSGVAVLPDIHAKPDNPFPTGTAVATKNTIYPSLIGQDIGCAMMLWHSSLKADQLTTEKVQKIFGRMVDEVVDSKPKKRVVSNEILTEMLKDPAAWGKKEGVVSVKELKRIEHQGQFLSQDQQSQALSSIPRDSWKAGITKTKSLGGGNHFLEFQKIVEIYDNQVAKAIGIEVGDCLMWIHTGSGSLGKRLENYYTQRWDTTDTKRRLRQQWRRALFHLELSKLNRFGERVKYIQGQPLEAGLDADSPEGQRYLTGHRAAMNYALANRFLLSKLAKESLQEVFPDEDFELLVDVAHESIQKEKLPEGEYWIHRNGASRAIPPNAWQDPWEQGLGQLLPLPGSLGSDSYLAITKQGVDESFWAVNHGAGRVLEKPDARKMVSEEVIDNFNKQRGQKIFYAGGGEDIAEQVPEAFKDINAVVGALEEHNLAGLVARTEPIASLKA